MISDLTEFATRLYFRADCSAFLVRVVTTLGSSPSAAILITGQKCRWVKSSVRSSSTNFVPSARHSYESGFNLPRSAAQMNIIMMQVLAAATKASSGVNTPGWPWASTGAERFVVRMSKDGQQNKWMV